jgi:hypothetical protein
MSFVGSSGNRMTVPNQVLAVFRDNEEALTVDFKWRVSLESQSQRKEFARDIVALANTIAADPQGKAYLVLGVRDPAQVDRFETRMDAVFKPFGDRESIRNFSRLIQDLAIQYCRPAPNIEYDEFDGSAIGRKALGIITVHKALAYPVRTANFGHPDDNDIALIRAGPGDPRRRNMTPEEVDAQRLAQFSQEPLAKLLGKTLADELKPIRALLETQNLFSLLTDEEPSQRSQALQMVSKIDRDSDQQARHLTQVVIGFFQDEVLTVKWQAVQTVRAMHHPVAVDSLFNLCRAHLESETSEIVISGIEAIGELSQDIASIPRLYALLEAFQNPNTPEELDTEVVDAVALAELRIRQRVENDNKAGVA